MKITRSLSLKNTNNKIVKKIKIIYDVSLERQEIEIITFEKGNIIRKKSSKKYTLEEIEIMIINKIKSGYQVYSTPKEKNISFNDFQKEIKHLFKKPKSPILKSNTLVKKKERNSINTIEKIINSYKQKDLLKEIKKYNLISKKTRKNIQTKKEN